MVSLFDEMVRLYSILNPPMSDGPGRLVQFMSANRGEGTSTIAREFARVAILHSQQNVLLLDLNSSESGQFDFFEEASREGETGVLSEPLDCGIDPDSLWRLTSDVRVNDRSNAPRGPLMSFHRVGTSKLLVSRFHTEALAAGETAQVTNQPGFWDGLRQSVDLTIIDSPPASEAYDGVAVSGVSDAVVLVVEAENTRVPVVQDLRDRISTRGGNLVGVVFNKRRYHIPQPIYRLL